MFHTDGLLMHQVHQQNLLPSLPPAAGAFSHAILAVGWEQRPNPLQ